MRILVLCHEFPPLGGGGSRVCDGLARALVAHGHEVEMIASGFSGLPRTHNAGRFRAVRLPTPRRRIDRGNVIELAVYVLFALIGFLRRPPDRRAEIRHVRSIFPDGLVAWAMRKLLNVQYIITARGSDVPGYNRSRFPVLHRLLKPVWRRVVRDAECVVCASDILAELTKKADITQNPIDIPNGLDIGRFRPRPGRANAALCVSRLFERKGVQHLLRAIDDVDLRVTVHIVGDGPARARLEIQAVS